MVALKILFASLNLNLFPLASLAMIVLPDATFDQNTIVFSLYSSEGCVGEPVFSHKS
jgi:hypothetical protein